MNPITIYVNEYVVDLNPPLANKAGSNACSPVLRSLAPVVPRRILEQEATELPVLKLEILYGVVIPANVWYTVRSRNKVRNWEAFLPDGEAVKNTVLYRLEGSFLKIFTTEALLNVTFNLEVE